MGARMDPLVLIGAWLLLQLPVGLLAARLLRSGKDAPVPRRTSAPVLRKSA